ncbi:DUF1869 domain-containing protein, partial [Escherichia coli]
VRRQRQMCIRDRVNTVRSYDTENEHDVCGW